MVSRSVAQTRALIHHSAPLLEWVSLQEASGSPRYLYKALQTILCHGNGDRPTMVMSPPKARNHQEKGSQFRTHTVLFTAKNTWYLVILLAGENGRSVTQTGLDNAHTMDPTHTNNIPTSRINLWWQMANENSLPSRWLCVRSSFSSASRSPSCRGMMPDKEVWGNGQDEIVRNPTSVYCPFRRQQRERQVSWILP